MYWAEQSYHNPIKLSKPRSKIDMNLIGTLYLYMFFFRGLNQYDDLVLTWIYNDIWRASLDVPDGEQPGARVPSPRLHRGGARPLILIITGRLLTLKTFHSRLLITIEYFDHLNISLCEFFIVFFANFEDIFENNTIIFVVNFTTFFYVSGFFCLPCAEIFKNEFFTRVADPDWGRIWLVAQIQYSFFLSLKFWG